eukprot:IDg11884t1
MGGHHILIEAIRLTRCRVVKLFDSSRRTKEREHSCRYFAEKTQVFRNACSNSDGSSVNMNVVQKHGIASTVAARGRNRNLDAVTYSRRRPVTSCSLAAPR